MIYRRNRKTALKKAPVRKMVKKVMKKRAPVSLSIKSYVQKALGKAIENKVPAPLSSTDALLVPITNTVSWGTLIPLANVFNVTQGVGQGQRVGDKIRPKRWNFRGFIHNNGSASIPYVVKMFIFKLKLTYEDPTGPAYSGPVDFYQNGSTSQGPVNNYQDIMRTVNTDKYQIYTTRTFKVGAAGVGGGNNDFKAVCPFNINLLKYQDHRLTYNDSVTNTPQNAGLYACFAIANFDGTSGVPGTNAPQLSYDVNAEYEDA